MKNILVPTDFSKESGYAIDFAIELAEKAKAKLHILNVVEMPVSPVADPMGAPIVYDWDTEFITEVSQVNKESLKQVIEEMGEARVDASSVEVGVMLDITLNYIDSHNIDLVVMGTSGATGLKEIFIGSNAEKVVRFSPCPVITVANPVKINEIQEIVFGLDLSGKEQKVVPDLKTLQKLLNVKIHFVFINTPRALVNEEEAMSQMKLFIAKNNFEDCTIDVRRNILIEPGIFEFAQETSADMIAMASSHRKGLSHFFFGSLAEDLVNHALVPVWTLSLKSRAEESHHNN